MIKKTIIWLPVIFYCSLIFYLSSLESIQLPVTFWNIDKLLHLVEYGALAFLFLFALDKTVTFNKRALSIMTILFCLFYGISDEMHQYFVPGRFACVVDLIFNLTGAYFATNIYFFVKRKWGENQGSH